MRFALLATFELRSPYPRTGVLLRAALNFAEPLHKEVVVAVFFASVFFFANKLLGAKETPNTKITTVRMHKDKRILTSPNAQQPTIGIISQAARKGSG